MIIFYGIWMIIIYGISWHIAPPVSPAPVGAARIRLLFPEQMGKLNGASSCNLLLASPGGKLLSVARPMRGGDRLVHECS